MAAQLATSAAQRLAVAFRPATQRTYMRMFRDFLGFLVAAGLSYTKVSHHILLMFMEFLAQNGLSQSNIANYMAGIRAQFIIHNLETSPFQHDQIHLFHRSLKINRPLNPTVHQLITTDILHKIIHTTTSLDSPVVFTALYLLAFYSFMRISNMLPHTISSFDPSRQLARGDIIFSELGATIVVKWSKTIQNRKDIHTIAIPSLGRSPLCPSRALQALLAVAPAHNNSPLFTCSTKRGVVPLTDSVARKHLKQVSQLLGLYPHLKFHDFRRSGATWAFHQGVPLHHIMHHGTWQSDSVWKYIKSTPQATSPVASAFQRALLI